MLKRKVTTLAKKLMARGVTPIKMNIESDLSDPAIWITETIYIQVGTDYIAIFKDRPTGLVIYECDNDIDDVMNKLSLAIEEGKPK